MKDFFRRAAARYLAFIRGRYVRASRGDGTWKPLAASTKVARLRRQHGKRFHSVIKAAPGKNRGEQLASLAAGTAFAILRDTSTLFGSLTEGAPGSSIDYVKDGILLGTRVFYAKYHQNPTVPGRPPKREIFVQPDKPTEEAIAIELANGIVAAFGGVPPSGGTSA